MITTIVLILSGVAYYLLTRKKKDEADVRDCSNCQYNSMKKDSTVCFKCITSECGHLPYWKEDETNK